MRPSFAIGFFFVTGTLVLGGSLAGAGCTVLTNDGPPDDAGRFEGGDGGPTAACASCIADQCTGQWALCLTDPACAEAHRCATAASDPSACVCTSVDASVDADTDGGDIADPRGIYRAFASCTDTKTTTSCKDDCPGDAKKSNVSTCSDEDAGTTDAGDDGATTDAGNDADTDAAATDASAGDAGTTAPVTPTVDGCVSCTSSQCGDQKKSCATGTECAAYLECAYVAADATAADDCAKQHATGKAAAVELASCMRAGCGEVCGF